MDSAPSKREQDTVPDRANDPQEKEHEYKPDRQCRPPRRWEIGASKPCLNSSGHFSREAYGRKDRQKRGNHQSDGRTRESKRLHNGSLPEAIMSSADIVNAISRCVN
jgi:hypothetical protein